MNTTTVSLLERLRQPDAEAAWARFVDLYTPLLYDWVRHYGFRDQDAADLVQDVFVILVKRLPEFRHGGQGCFRAWLRAILWNLCRERWKKRSPRPAGDLRLDTLAGPAEPAAAEEEEYRNYLVNRLLRLLQPEFKPTTWKAFCEHVVEGKPAAEVARACGMTVNAVYLTKSRVLRRLREELAGLLD